MGSRVVALKQFYRFPGHFSINAFSDAHTIKLVDQNIYIRMKPKITILKPLRRESSPLDTAEKRCTNYSNLT